MCCIPVREGSEPWPGGRESEAAQLVGKEFFGGCSLSTTCSQDRLLWGFTDLAPYFGVLILFIRLLGDLHWGSPVFVHPPICQDATEMETDATVSVMC